MKSRRQHRISQGAVWSRAKIRIREAVHRTKKSVTSAREFQIVLLNEHMRPDLILSVGFCFFLCVTPAIADGGKIYSGSSGYEVAGRVEEGRVYYGSSGDTVAARIDENRIYAGGSGYTVLARFEWGKIYGRSSGYTVIGRIEGLIVYRGSSGYAVACRGEGTGGMSLAAAALCS